MLWDGLTHQPTASVSDKLSIKPTTFITERFILAALHFRVSFVFECLFVLCLAEVRSEWG